jgi:hypothetical protein
LNAPGTGHGVVALGDSLINGYGPPVGGLSCVSWAGWLAWALLTCLTQHGVNGATTRQVRHDQVPLLQGHYRVGAIWCGANDLGNLDPVPVLTALRDTCSAAAEHCDLVAIATVPSTLRIPRMHWRDLDERRVLLNALIRQAAADAGVVVVELDAALGGGFSMAPNRQHPTALGNLEAAGLAASALAAHGVHFARHLPLPGSVVVPPHEAAAYRVSARERLRGGFSGWRDRRR